MPGNTTRPRAPYHPVTSNKYGTIQYWPWHAARTKSPRRPNKPGSAGWLLYHTCSGNPTIPYFITPSDPLLRSPGSHMISLFVCSPHAHSVSATCYMLRPSSPIPRSLSCAQPSVFLYLRADLRRGGVGGGMKIALLSVGEPCKTP